MWLSSFYPVDLPRLVGHPLNTQDMTEEVLLCLGQFLHAFLKQREILLFEFFHLLPEEGELIEIFEIVFEHNDRICILFVLLILIFVEI